MDNILIDDYKNLIWKMTTKFYGVDKEDLFQAGCLGLLKALQNYKKDSNAKFSTYAVNYIFGEMYLISNNKNIKYNKDMLKLYKLIERTRYQLAQNINKIPSNSELAEYLEMSLCDIDYATMIGNEIMSLDNDELDTRPIYDTISGNDENIDERLYIEESLNSLNDSEREIIESRYFKDMTQEEIARKLKMTQVMVSRYEKKGKEKLREYMTL